MQYSVQGIDGNAYGPVDLVTIQGWIKEGRVLPESVVTDELGNRTAKASEFAEFGFQGVPSPPSSFAAYPRPEAQAVASKRPTKLWGILVWFAIAVIASFFYNFWPLWITGFNIIDALRARARKDPKADWCMFVGIGGFVLMVLWSIFKSRIGAW